MAARPGRLGALLALAALAGAAASPVTRAAEPAAPRVIVLHAPPAQVFDGDTFAADLNGDGRIAAPGEHVRLLYVDTPELHPSPKGQDLRHGLPARNALARLLSRPPLRLTVPAGRTHDPNGRTLARVNVGERDVSALLIAAGHSYFDTRFGFPPDRAALAAAEAEAFTARHGIWDTPASRRAWLARLREEGKTPRAADNPAFLPGVYTIATLDPLAHMGRYATVEGTLARERAARKGVRLLELTGGGRELTAVLFSRRARALGDPRWPAGARLRVAGFLQLYQGRPQLAVHHAEAAGGPARR